MFKKAIIKITLLFNIFIFSSSAFSITKEQKLDVIKLIGECIEKSMVYIDKNPAYHDLNNLKKFWDDIWNTDQYAYKKFTSPYTQQEEQIGTVKNKILLAYSDAEFERQMNTLLSVFCSHLTVQQNNQPSLEKHPQKSNTYTSAITEYNISEKLEDKYKEIYDENFYIKVPGFMPLEYPGYYITQCMEYAIRKKLPHVILDLRENPGGRFENCLHLLDFFLPDCKPLAVGIDRELWDKYRIRVEYQNNWATFDATKACPLLAQLVGFATRFNDNECYAYQRKSGYFANPNYCTIIRPYRGSKNKATFTGKVVILINKNSASASEDFTGIMSTHYPNCVVVGEASSGSLLSNYAEPDAAIHGFNINYPHRLQLLTNGYMPESNSIHPHFSMRINNPADIFKNKELLEWLKPIPKPEPVIPQKAPTPPPVEPVFVDTYSESSSSSTVIPMEEELEEPVNILIDTDHILTLKKKSDPAETSIVFNGITYQIKSIKQIKDTYIRVLHLEKPILDLESVPRFQSSGKTTKELAKEGYRFTNEGPVTYIQKRGERKYLYGVTGWNPEDPHRTHFSARVNNLINNIILTCALIIK